jgi:uncharacterized membrane protein (UPF0127 family)
MQPLNAIKILSIAVTMLIGIASSQAFSEEPVVFNRDTILIVPKAEDIIAEKLNEAKKVDDKENSEKDTSIPKTRVKKEVMVNIRPEVFLQQPGVFNLQPFMDAGGLLIILTDPRINALQANNIYASVDVLFIAADGTITQIAPSITPSNLEGSIDTQDETTALLFLKDGESESKDIRPGDMVLHSLFKAKPVILRQ